MTRWPEGFVPEDYNPSHPVFDAPSVQYGAADNPMPEGDYNIQITDNCGTTASYGISLSNDSEPVYLVYVEPSTCLGEVLIRLLDRGIGSVVLTSAPAEYTEPLPQDLTAVLTPEGDFAINGLPLGTYIFEVTDACGELFELEIDILPPPAEFHIDQRPGCEPGEGSAMIWMEDDSVSSAQITAAPPAFEGALPYDISASVADDALFVSSLPEGYYVF